MKLAWRLGKAEWRNMVLRRQLVQTSNELRWTKDELEAQQKIVSSLTRSLAVAIGHPSMSGSVLMGGRAVGRDY